MSTSFSSIKQLALSLSVKEREQLANALFDSLTAEAQKEIELLWVKEAEQRYSGIVSGNVPIIAGEEVSQKIKELLG